jgi:serine/threonine-protein kinase
MDAIPARLAEALAGRYRLERELGAGGAATVYLAEDLKHDRRVAIKVLRPQIAEALGPERFEDEIRIAARLHHPHILAVHDSGEADGFLYYVMPYVEGQSLRERLQDGGRMPVSQVARILSEVADALGDAHAAGIVHRDIKPENILLSGRHALVADFGVAKAIHDAGNRKTTTSMGLALGTPAYMSPEQATADPALDHRADLYALGVVAYEMLAGHPPFSGTAQQILAAHNVTPPEPIARLRPDIPPALAALVMKALAKSPGDRWQTAEAMQAQLEPLLGTSSGGVTPTLVLPGAARRRTDRRAPRRGLLLAAAGVAVALVAFAAWRVDHDRTVAASADEASGDAALPAAAGKSIAVLPFANLSSDKDNAYFADGIQDEIITRLAKIGEIKVISRTSTLRYASQPENLPQIAKELGVANVLEGTVQKVGDRVRINVQLVRARDDSHLWAETYDRKLDDVFGIQSEVATAIANAMQATLTSAEKAQVAATPTTNPAAYDAYLKGLSLETRANFSHELNERARDFYIEATRLDPKFVEAWTHLVSVRSFLYSNGVDHDAAGLAALKQAADTVVRLRPGSGEAWLSTGYYRYRGLRDLAGALDAFERAEKLLPNNVDVVGVIGAVERRLGRMADAEAHLQRAADLDPGNASWLGTLGELLNAQRRYSEARTILDKGLRLSPGDTDFLSYKIESYQAEGNLAAAGQLLATLPPPRDGDDQTLGSRQTQAIYERRFEDALALCELLAKPATGGSEGAIRKLRFLSCKAEVQDYTHDPAASGTYREALATLDALRKDGVDDELFGTFRARALSGLGQTAPALAAIDRTVAAVRGDGKSLPSIMLQRAQVLLHAGDQAGALAILEESLRTPFGTTPALLRLDPNWDALRDNPRFRALSREKP